jgi:hypothetical protein
LFEIMPLNLNNFFLVFPRDANGKNKQPAFDTDKLNGKPLPAWTKAYYKGDVFTCPCDSIATNGGKGKNPRMEAREAKGGKNSFWSLKQGGTMTYEFRVLEPVDRFVCGQIHNKENEPMKVFVEKDKVYVGEDISNKTYELGGPPGNGWHKVSVKAKNSTITVIYDGVVVSYKQKDDGKNYFKIGCYFVGKNTTGSASVEIRNVKITHP